MIQGQTLTFKSLQLHAGTAPKAVHIADFNGDKWPDIAVVNTAGANQNSVTVVLRKDSTTFGSAITTPTGQLGSLAMATGDFNADGKVDVAVVNHISNNVSILFGNGTGTFQIGGTYTVGMDPVAITAGDLNHDGLLDLAVVNSSTGDVTILLGTTGGTFRNAGTVYVGGAPTDVAIADFDGDGVPDLGVTNGTLGMQVLIVLLGKGDGTFQTGQSIPVGNEPYRAATSDFNADGKADLGIANLASNNVSIVMGSANGSIAPPVNYSAGTGPTGIAIGDFNLDGKIDLAVCNDVSATARSFWETGTGRS